MALNWRKRFVSPARTAPRDAAKGPGNSLERAPSYRLTRLGLWWERAAQAFWPLWTALAVLYAVFALGLVNWLAADALTYCGLGAAVILAGLAVWGMARLRRVRPTDVIERLDDQVPGRPFSALMDQAAMGGEGALWQAHMDRSAQLAGAARAVAPDPELASRDPFALRLMALVALCVALLFGSAAQFGQGVSAVAATITGPTAQNLPVDEGALWEGWAESPAYTGRPTIYLNALPADEILDLPKGSVLSFRLYRENLTFNQSIGVTSGDLAQAPQIKAEESGRIVIGELSFSVRVRPDLPPSVQVGKVSLRRADGKMVQSFRAEDDYAIDAAAALITLDLDKVPRRFGLAAPPEPRAPLRIEITTPQRGDRTLLQSQLAADLSRHPWANMPVEISFEVKDSIGQPARSTPVSTELRGRRFFDPIAAAMIELRRDLLWSRANAERSAQILRALLWRPEGYVNQALLPTLHGAVDRLETDHLDSAARDQVAELLWAAAVELEDGGLSDALEKMRQAQEKLSEAIRNGASPDEIDRLMAELKAATDEYLDMLAEQNKTDPAERFSKNQERQEITGDQIQQMMDEIQRLMREGRMAEAQQLLEQFNRMMQNMQVQQSQSGNGEQGRSGGGQAEELNETLREQRRLSDDVFREMQRQFSGVGDEDSASPQELAERQEELRRQLQDRAKGLSGQQNEGEQGPQRQLDEAGQAMEEAERRLRDGDTAGAMQNQADAIEALREGLRGLSARENSAESNGQSRDANDQQQRGGQSAQDRADRGAGGGETQGGRDPLGRESASGGNTAGGVLETEEGAAPQAEELFGEIQRRLSEPDRPNFEQDYLNRLLERF